MSPGMMNIVMIVAMFAIFYFLLIRPQQKTPKRQ
ncbi:preprotein translocase subunit YajC [Bacillus cytotoxicus]